jgi:hypothetical protein
MPSFGLRKIRDDCVSSRVNERLLKSFNDSGVSEERSCCKTISSTVPARSGRSFFAATNLSLTKLTWTEPPITAKRNAPSGLSPIGGPRICTTSARRDLKGSIPFHEAASTRSEISNNAKTITLVAVQRRKLFFGRFIAMMLVYAQGFAKGRTRSKASLKSGSSGAISSAF